MPTIIVDNELCNGDSVCVDICPMNCFDMENDKSVPNRADDCIMCMACVSACPTEAIIVED
jgi:NAD-dependent dihydropyrimidine dehydrogenase PreA subunit